MKIALLSIFAIVTFSGCTKTTVNNTVNQAFSAVYTIKSNQWVAGKDPDQTVFYYATLPIAELDQIIDQHGGVNVYLSFNGSSTDPTYEALPEVVSGIAYGTFHTTGLITIDLRNADGTNISGPITSDTQVKVILIDAHPLN